MTNKILTPMAYIAILVFVFVIITLTPIGALLLPPSQDILFTASTNEAIIGVDGMMIARGQVCLPKVKRGVHTFSAQLGENRISDEFFVSNNVVIINDEQKKNKGKDQIVENAFLQLRAETTSCAASTFDQ